MANIIEPIQPGFVRNVQTNAPIYTKHKETYVVPKTYACAESQLFKEVVKVELRTRSAGIAVQSPHIASIEE